MKAGVCAPIRYWRDVADMGYSYVESNLSEVAACGAEAFGDALDIKREYSVDVRTFNGFFPGSISLYGALSDVTEYTERALERAALLGGRIAVLGSGASRRIGDRLEREAAKEKILTVAYAVSDIAGKYGIKVALEPLNRNETDMLNTIAECADICRLVSSPHLGLITDIYHLYMENECLNAITDSGDLVLHAHIASPDKERALPRLGDKEAYTPWLDALKSIGYAGGISLECVMRGDFKTALAEYREFAQYIEKI